MLLNVFVVWVMFRMRGPVSRVSWWPPFLGFVAVYRPKGKITWPARAAGVLAAPNNHGASCHRGRLCPRCVFSCRTSLAGWFCRSTERELRRRVRKILVVCQADGGYCLGSGNSIAKYVPLDNYLVMLDGGPALGRVKTGKDVATTYH